LKNDLIYQPRPIRENQFLKSINFWPNFKKTKSFQSKHRFGKRFFNLQSRAAKLFVGFACCVSLPGCLSFGIGEPNTGGLAGVVNSFMITEIQENRFVELRPTGFSFNWAKTPAEASNPAADTVPFTGAYFRYEKMSLCNQKADRSCLAFSIGVEVMQRPGLLERIVQVLSAPCAAYPEMEGRPWPDPARPRAHSMSPYYARWVPMNADTWRLRGFFGCDQPKRHHHEITLSIIKNLDRITLGPQVTSVEFKANTINQINLQVY
jgi:hypothetical protein